MNKPTLRQLRRSYRAHAGPRSFGPVGIQLTAEQRRHTNRANDFWDTPDDACSDCGHHVCSCTLRQLAEYGPRALGLDAYAYSRWVEAKPEDAPELTVADMERAIERYCPPRACPHCSYRGDGDNHCPSCPTRKAAEAGEALAPGWTHVPADGDLLECWSHVSGAGVALCAKRYFYSSNFDNPTSDFAPTRDEAMARALGWQKSESPVAWISWRGPDGSVAVLYDEPTGIWTAYRGSSRDITAAEKVPMLPHAIAWCRGEAS